MQVIRRYASLLYVSGVLPTVRRETPLSVFYPRTCLLVSLSPSVCLGRRRVILWLCTPIGKWAENKHWVNDGHRHAVPIT